MRALHHRPAKPSDRTRALHHCAAEPGDSALARHRSVNPNDPAPALYRPAGPNDSAPALHRPAEPGDAAPARRRRPVFGPALSVDPPLPGEFSLIARHFKRLAGPGSLGLTDDAAVFDPPPGRHLVAAADAMVAGVHFLPDDPPDTIGRKLLRVNLSDLAAMGAAPLGYLLTVALSHGTPDAWIAAFAAGLAADNAAFGVHALGGDTVSTPGPATLSLTVLGTVAPGAALLRSGARPGDRLWVSGTLGDGALGLRVLRGELAPDPAGHLARRYRLPEPRLALGAALAGVATAAMDVSDGAAQDLGHLCRASGCGAVVEAAAVPLSDAARAAVAADPALLALALGGGDDYELLFAAPPARSQEVLARAAAAGTPVAPIGVFTEGPPEVAVRGADGAPVPVPRGGWSHF